MEKHEFFRLPLGELFEPPACDSPSQILWKFVCEAQSNKTRTQIQSEGDRWQRLLQDIYGGDLARGRSLISRTKHMDDLQRNRRQSQSVQWRPAGIGRRNLAKKTSGTAGATARRLTRNSFPIRRANWFQWRNYTEWVQPCLSLWYSTNGVGV